MGLSDVLKDDAKKNAIVNDCCTLLDEEVASKGGLSGLAVKAGYSAVKGIKPGFVKHTVEGPPSNNFSNVNCKSSQSF